MRDNCEVQSNSAVAKALFDDATVIGQEVPWHCCFISHGTKIGKRARIAPGAVVCGLINIGDDVWIGPNATVNGLFIGMDFHIYRKHLVESVAEGGKAYAQFAKVKRV